MRRLEENPLQLFALISLTTHVLIMMITLTQITRAATFGSRPLTVTPDIQTLSQHVNKTCLTRSCNDTLNEIYLEQLKRNIDWNVKACDDFYKHACGNWLPPSNYTKSSSMLQVAEKQLTTRFVELFESALIDRDTQWRRYDQVKIGAAINRAAQRQTIRRARRHHYHEMQKQMNAVRIRRKRPERENNVDMTHEPQIEKEDFELVFSKLLQYYRVCLNAAPLTLRGYYEQLLTEGLLQPRRRHWQEMLANFVRYGYGESFVFFRVRQQNATQHDITILPHDVNKRLNLTQEIYDILSVHTHFKRIELAEKFRKLENDIQTIVNKICIANEKKQNNNSTEIPAIVSDEVLALSDQPLSPTNTDMDCDLMETLNMAELTTRCSEIDWQRFIGAPLGRHLHANDLVRIDSIETVCTLARYHNQAQNAELNFLYTLARFLSYLQQQQYNPVRLGGSSINCIRHMRKTLSIAMTYIYDHEYYTAVREESDHIIHSVFAQLKLEFAKTLTLNRMEFDVDIIAYLKQKLNAIRLNLGNLPPKVNSSFYVDLIWQLNVSESNFYQNHLHALAHAYGHVRRLVSSISKNHSRSSWYTFNYHEPTFVDSLDSTPYYFCLSNMIVVPHAYLQMPFYDRQFWPILIYGDLANTLGHELIHSFDSNFLEYDYVGNMNEAVMQRIASNVNFVRNIKCLSEGTKFLSERIADVSGTRLALNAFLNDTRSVQMNGRLFFMQFAQFFCSNGEEATHEPADAWHDPDAVRLNNTLAQMPEFMTAFECPASSAMVATQRCELW